MSQMKKTSEQNEEHHSNSVQMAVGRKAEIA